MINNDRIVPIERTDLLTMYGTVLSLCGTSYQVVKAETIPGAYAIKSTSDDAFLPDQPVQSLDFADGVTAATVYFVAAYDFKGFSIAGVAAETDEVITDACTLYKAELATGTVTVTALSPIVSA